jgi:hypothetical protein
MEGPRLIRCKVREVNYLLVIVEVYHFILVAP